MKLLYKYKNGNYNVTLFSDGTKIRETNDDKFIADFPENIDVKITDFCAAGCNWCHEKSTTMGLHSEHLLTAKYFDTLQPGSEIAIGGGNLLDHPLLYKFLERMKNNNIVSNITVNQYHFVQDRYRTIIDNLVEKNLVYGIGISMLQPTENFINLVKQYDNLVIHTIAGINPLSQFEKLYSNNLKVLILGYKNFGRGEKYYSDKVQENISIIANNLSEITRNFKVTSFDNLAIEQLNPKKLMTEEQWQQFYMGDDGNFTFYIDAVKNQFAKNSTSKTRYSIEPWMTVKDMFDVVKFFNK